MNFFSKIFLPIFIATTWISVSEFATNEFLLKPLDKTYENLGLIFPSEARLMVQSRVYMVISLFYLYFIVSRRFSLI